MTNKKYYFTTRDLLLIASLAALGGITSAYINAIGDLVQSALGFSGLQDCMFYGSFLQWGLLGNLVLEQQREY